MPNPTRLDQGLDDSLKKAEYIFGTLPQRRIAQPAEAVRVEFYVTKRIKELQSVTAEHRRADTAGEVILTGQQRGLLTAMEARLGPLVNSINPNLPNPDNMGQAAVDKVR